MPRIVGGSTLAAASSVVAETGFGQGSIIGTSTAYARADHSHGTPGLSSSAGGALIFGGTGAAGTGSTAARGDHTHTLPQAPVTSVNTRTGAVTGLVEDTDARLSDARTPLAHAHAAGDITSGVISPDRLATGTRDGTKYLRDDGTWQAVSSGSSVSPATTVVAETSYDQASAVGTGTLYARNDHSHGTPSLSGVAGGALTVGGTGAAGTGTVAARSDHTHTVPGFGTITAQTAYGAASGNGSATTIARSDHTHGTPALGASAGGALTFGGTGAAGTATTPARNDHTHTVPALPTNLVTTDTTQTISGAKTLTSSPTIQAADPHVLFDNTFNTGSGLVGLATQTDSFVTGSAIGDLVLVPDTGSRVFTGAALRANGGLYDGANRAYSAGNAPPAPSNMVTTDTAQTITGLKTLGFAEALSALVLTPTTVATSGDTGVDSPALTWWSQRWDGAGSVANAIHAYAERISATADDQRLRIGAGLRLEAASALTGDTLLVRKNSVNQMRLTSAGELIVPTVVVQEAAPAIPAAGTVALTASGIFDELTVRHPDGVYATLPKWHLVQEDAGTSTTDWVGATLSGGYVSLTHNSNSWKVAYKATGVTLAQDIAVECEVMVNSAYHNGGTGYLEVALVDYGDKDYGSSGRQQGARMQGRTLVGLDFGPTAYDALATVADLVDGSWYKIRMVKVGNLHIAYFNGSEMGRIYRPVTTAAERQYYASFGVYGTAGTVSARNFKVWIRNEDHPPV